MRTKLIAAMSVYTALAVIAGFWTAGAPRIAVWILLGGLALKTLIAHKAGW